MNIDRMFVWSKLKRASDSDYSLAQRDITSPFCIPAIFLSVESVLRVGARTRSVFATFVTLSGAALNTADRLQQFSQSLATSNRTHTYTYTHFMPHAFYAIITCSSRQLCIHHTCM